MKPETFFQRPSHRDFREIWVSAHKNLKRIRILRGTCSCSLKDTSSRKSRLAAVKKGQPEGNAVKGVTGKPRVAKTDRKT